MTVKRSMIVFFSLLLLTIFSMAAYADNIVIGTSGVNATSFWPANGTFVRGAVAFNVSLSPSVIGQTNVSNITISIRHIQSGLFYNVARNQTANLTSYVMENSTLGLPNGLYAFNITVLNQSGVAPANFYESVVAGNFTIDNSPPVIIWNMYPVNNQTNNTLIVNFSVSDQNNTISVNGVFPGNFSNFLNCTLFVDDTSVNTSTNFDVGASGGGGNFTANMSLTVLTTDKKDHTAYVACHDIARTGRQSGVVGNRNTTTTITFTTETRGA